MFVYQDDATVFVHPMGSTAGDFLEAIERKEGEILFRGHKLRLPAGLEFIAEGRGNSARIVTLKPGDQVFGVPVEYETPVEPPNPAQPLGR